MRALNLPGVEVLLDALKHLSKKTKWDFRVEHHGCVCLVVPVSTAGHRWIAETRQQSSVCKERVYEANALQSVEAVEEFLTGG
jgi:hypothetical protein